MYIGDRDNNRIRKVNTAGIITTIAGNGLIGYSGDDSLAINAKIDQPYGVAVDGSGNVYFVDAANSRVRKVNTSGIITTIAGTGTSTSMGIPIGAGYNGDNIVATTAELNHPVGIALDVSGNIYITDPGNNRVRKVNTSGIITTIAGTGAEIDSGDNGLATAAGLYIPYAITLDGNGNIYIGEDDGNRVRKVNTSGIITTIAGTGTADFSGDGGQATDAELQPCCRLSHR